MRRPVLARLALVVAALALLLVTGTACGLKKELHNCDSFHSFFHENPGYAKLPDALRRVADHQASNDDRTLIADQARQLHQIAQEDDTRVGTEAKRTAIDLSSALDGSLDEAKANKLNKALLHLNNTSEEACSNISGQ